MAQKNLRAFMREEVKTEQIVTAPGPATILGEDGNPIVLEIKVLSNAAVKEINDRYITREMAVDKNGRPYIQDGEVAFKTTRNSSKATGHILAEALVFPDLKDKELMEFFNCHEYAEMAAKVFPRADEFAHVNQVVLAALGFAREAANDDNSETVSVIEQVKN